MEEKRSCLTCRHKDVCIKRSMTLFALFIQTGRYAEAEKGKETLGVSADCENYDAKDGE